MKDQELSREDSSLWILRESCDPTAEYARINAEYMEWGAYSGDCEMVNNSESDHSVWNNAMPVLVGARFRYYLIAQMGVI